MFRHRLLYNLLLWLTTPLVLLRLLIKSRRHRGYRHYIAERFAYQLPDTLPLPLWFHTVSVGEFLALKPLLTLLLDKHPSLSLWLTCTTPTGREQLSQFCARYPTRIRMSYFPYDLPRVIRRFLRHVNPRAVVIMETELWVNLLSIAQKNHIPTLLINARLSAKALRNYYRFAYPLFFPSMQKLLISAQTQTDARRLSKLGAKSTNICVIPSIKFVLPAPISQESTAQALADFLSLPANTWLWIAASTHSPEEQWILKAHQHIITIHPEARLCLAPRHPERRDEIQKITLAAGFIPCLRSQNELPTTHNHIAILDTLGELNSAYSYADVAFIGGSLIPHGGQNPLAAIQQGCAVCFGAHMHNFQAIQQQLLTLPFVHEVTICSLADNIIALHKWCTTHGNRDILSYARAQSANVLASHYTFLTQKIPFTNSLYPL